MFIKNYSGYTMTRRDVLFNVPATKRVRTRHVPIIWTDNDEEGALYPHEDALVISAVVVSKKFNRILVNIGVSIDVLFKSTLDEINIIGLVGED